MISSNKHTFHATDMMPLIIERLNAGQNVRGLTFQGVSMRPMLREETDTVEVTASPEILRRYDLPVYCGPDGKFVMHRIVDVKPDHYVCLGDNTYHYEKVRREQIVAVVCAFQRNGKRFSVEAPSYRLYCRVWVAIYPLRRLFRQIKGKIGRCLRRLLK